MKALQVTLFVFLVSFSLVQAQKTKPDSFQYKISLTTEKSEYALGEPVVINVLYSNGSDALWKLHRPDSSSYNSLNYRGELWRSNVGWKGYYFNQSVFINDNTKCSRCGFSIPMVGSKVQIKPGESYVFRTDILSDHELDYLLPGKYKVAYRDGYECISSDTVEFCLKFASQSVDHLLRILVGERRYVENVRWAITLLRQIYPDIRKFHFAVEDGMIVYPADQFDRNMNLLRDFSNYWEKERDTDVMKKKISQINVDLKKYKFIDKRKARQMNDCCGN